MAQTRPSAPASDYSCPSSSLVRCGLESPEEYGVLQGSRACPLEAPAPGLQICICWICSLDGALPLGQEALISCVGGVGTRSGGPTEPSLMLFGSTGRQSFCLRLFPSSRGSRKERSGWEAQTEAGEGSECHEMGVGSPAGSMVSR